MNSDSGSRKRPCEDDRTDSSRCKVARTSPEQCRCLIQSKLDTLAADPDALANNITMLKGSDSMRLRIGDWRVLYSADAERIVVHAIAPRGSAYD